MPQATPTPHTCDLAQPGAPRRIAVIGGGSIAASFSHHLVRALQSEGVRDVEITVYDPAPALGPGVPYQADLDTNILNVPVGKMSALADDRTHFLHWLTERGLADPVRDALRYVPRRLFGVYLADLFSQTRASAERSGIGWRPERDTVTHLAPSGSRLSVRCASGAVSRADHAVLCIGNPAPRPLAGLAEHPRYVRNPYPTTGLAAIPPTARVGLIGTSLTAIDAVLALRSLGHIGPLHMTSRGGRLPSVRKPGLEARLQHLSEPQLRRVAEADGGVLTLERLHALFLHDFRLNGGSEAEWADALRPSRDAATYLRDEIQAAREQPRIWLALAAAFTATVDTAWSLMPVAERRNFMADFRQRWITRQVSFPLDNAVRIQALLDARFLSVGHGFQCVDRSADDRLALVEERDGQRTWFEVDYVVHATGSPGDAREADDPLVQAMLADGVAVADEFGGFLTDGRTGRLRNAAGHSVNIVPLGSLAAGTYFWTNQMSVNARLADAQARRIAAGFSRHASSTQPRETDRDWESRNPMDAPGGAPALT